jgi:hypothetical protein
VFVGVRPARTSRSSRRNVSWTRSSAPALVEHHRGQDGEELGPKAEVGDLDLDVDVDLDRGVGGAVDRHVG